ncbi:MAG: methionine biosynthesis protein MetW [Cellvibrionaceae bacterium]|uniref:methionine biosynthesis protein MetW n=1 Tax=uncultured Pseudoteredinibacter sp. TaxID=1641701 RepID=UPI00262663F9|nr:methionine biosynthesis protein MetW [uncultured Pseudoteredinibacter sp.]MCV6624160.1 methionine biosynthesis protein MetW [Cellvibrionaceae bacterium]
MRSDLDIISTWIKPGQKVLDLACGDGALLERLQEQGVNGYGLEIGPEQISRCIARGVNVVEQNLDQGLGNFADNSFDTVVMTQALQTMRFPHLVLQEMLRVGQECIVTFPNFGHWRARWHLAFSGRMPVSDLLPYQWYDTPNIHFCTFKDFEVLCQELSIEIISRRVTTQGSGRMIKQALPNFFGITAMYHLRKR